MANTSHWFTRRRRTGFRWGFRLGRPPAATVTVLADLRDLKERVERLQAGMDLVRSAQAAMDELVAAANGAHPLGSVVRLHPAGKRESA